MCIHIANHRSFLVKSHSAHERWQLGRSSFRLIICGLYRHVHDAFSIERRKQHLRAGIRANARTGFIFVFCSPRRREWEVERDLPILIYIFRDVETFTQKFHRHIIYFRDLPFGPTEPDTQSAAGFPTFDRLLKSFVLIVET